MKDSYIQNTDISFLNKKLDNHIQVAHNVEIGENTVIAAQTGIAGTTNTFSSLCSDALWDISAIATDDMSKAQVSVNQGTAVRVVSATTTCP